MILTLFDTGVREGELASMGMPDWDTHTVLVEGKTGFRPVPMGEASSLAIRRYTNKWGINDGRLWRSRTGTPLTPSGVLQQVKKLCAKARVEWKGVHAFRRTAAAQMKRLGMSDSDIMEICGWKSLAMLRCYTAYVADELAQEAHRRYSPGDTLQISRSMRGHRTRH